MFKFTGKSGKITRRDFIEIGTSSVLMATLSPHVSAHTGKLDMTGLAASYSWGPDNPPIGDRVPFVAEFDGYSTLKTNKYLEAYVDLKQGKNNSLQLVGPATLTVVFQLAKQWPMRAALISKWDFMPKEASYELGLTPGRKAYFRISSNGEYDKNVTELVSNKIIPKEKPVVLSAVFEPCTRMALYINGELSSELTKKVPARIYNSKSPVKLGQRFEGLLAGVWFHKKALNRDAIKEWAKTLSDTLPKNAPYKKWTRLKRNLPSKPATFLGTTAGMNLYKEIDIKPYKGSYVCPGDLDNDGRIDFLLYKNGSSYTVPGRVIAVDHDGKKLWEMGDPLLQEHVKAGKADVGSPGTTPALRGIATVYDIDDDGRSEVITELWEENKPFLYILDGATGKVKHRIESPLNMSIRQPIAKGLRQPSRSHPVIRIAKLHGKNEPASIIIKYGASNDVTCHAYALDSSLNIIWHIKGDKHSMGHIPTVADINGDGCDEVVLGHMLAGHDGEVLWDRGKDFEWHADTTAVAELIPGGGKQILISVCGIGPLYCLSPEGNILWQKTREEIEHGQAVWAGNFIEDLPGKEVIACSCGHVGSFRTFGGNDGRTLARFEHKKLPAAYPDFPTIVNWKSQQVQSLWIPQDRTLVDGRGKIVAELGETDEYVQKKLHCGTSWRPVGAQAFALDICGDERDELVLYEPYAGESIFIFSNPESDQKEKKYHQQSNAYNIRSYF
jgi:hypothetical protein